MTDNSDVDIDNVGGFSLFKKKTDPVAEEFQQMADNIFYRIILKAYNIETLKKYFGRTEYNGRNFKESDFSQSDFRDIDFKDIVVKDGLSTYGVPFLIIKELLAQEIIHISALIINIIRTYDNNNNCTTELYQNLSDKAYMTKCLCEALVGFTYDYYLMVHHVFTSGRYEYSGVDSFFREHLYFFRVTISAIIMEIFIENCGDQTSKLETVLPIIFSKKSKYYKGVYREKETNKINNLYTESEYRTTQDEIRAYRLKHGGLHFGGGIDDQIARKFSIVEAAGYKVGTKFDRLRYIIHGDAPVHPNIMNTYIFVVISLSAISGLIAGLIV